MQDLKLLSKSEFENFFNSFDQVLCDVHGVLWNVIEPIPGAPESLNLLQKLGKKVIIVSNNSTVLIEDYRREFEKAGVEIPEDNIITPILTIIYYLKKLNFSKKIYVSGTDALRESLERAGFAVVTNEFQKKITNLKSFGEIVTKDDEAIGAIIADIDFNLNYAGLQKSATYLKRADVIFLKGSADIDFKIGDDKTVMGVGNLYKLLEDYTGRKSILVGKPSPVLNDFITEKYNITNPKRVLFIGDSLSSDVAFASKFGYQKLLVFSGITKKDVLKNYDLPKEFKPDYYIDDLGLLYDIIKRKL